MVVKDSKRDFKRLIIAAQNAAQDSALLSVSNNVWKTLRMPIWRATILEVWDAVWDQAYEDL